MDVLPFEILSKIISNLTTTQKFLVREVCTSWDKVATDQLQRQKRLGIRDFNLRLSRDCVAADPAHIITDDDILVNYSDRLPLHVLKYFSSLTVVRIRVNCERDAEEAVALVASMNGIHMQCLSCCCNFFHKAEMPEMRHFLSGNVFTESSESLVTSSPHLSAISCRRMSSAVFPRLPNGLLALLLESEHANIQSIFRSPAAVTLHTLSFRITLGITSSAHFSLPSLSSLQIRGSGDIEFVPALLQSLTHSPNLKELDLYSMIHGGATNSAWMQLLVYVPKLELIKLSFQVVNDEFIEVLVACCPHLKEITFTDSRLTDRSLDLLSGLQRLSNLGLESWRNDFSDQAVIRLLHGACRNSLQNLVIISKSSVKTAQLMEEIRVIQNQNSSCLKTTYFHSQY